MSVLAGIFIVALYLNHLDLGHSVKNTPDATLRRVCLGKAISVTDP
jgi:hypothetical protein